MRKIAALEKVDIDQDPREALLKYAKVMMNLFHELLYTSTCKYIG